MGRRILVVLAGATVRDRIVPWLRRLVEPVGAEIRLLTVLSGRGAHDAERLTALLALDAVAAGLRDGGLPASAEVRFGEPVAAALEAAHDWGAEMIAVAGEAGRGLDAILRRSPVPVLLAVGDRVA
jgi:nucleotide-binding universal stress UspA family protein